ncbi:GNAT family N-acetyltransferase [Erysipelatoclostridium sp. An173]|uniref:GNAT family N-acetyltransferase n=1 Tax=Candidatus Erysipelatoclostridium merdavium TaxID=2838566 RepID=A0A9D1XNU7_9FIRM|nr:GNAT family N-acetyltransferase [Erysipelatoclostridium sp. An173]OUP74819.1 GNAT family N-acetyltransferase [Erysipelatoclostridium sp. An173]WRK55019.1 GNAT family N-acetyltransferase [Coprobacillaceae bacterium CR2/5/TPMF4]HIX82492.1 GNAT family N-acetyltransferase [Candidatus Erysipelatoclostridium merdavium]
MDKQLTFRFATEKDVPLILKFIKGIAEYEKMLDEVETTEELLHEYLFEKQRAEVIFAIVDNVEVGFALFFHNFSTFVGKSGLYLEDIFVWPQYRGKGYGKAIFKQLVKIANERDCGRMEWVCLNWNQPSIDFYLSLNAKPLDEWTTYRLDKEGLKALAEK